MRPMINKGGTVANKKSIRSEFDDMDEDEDKGVTNSKQQGK